MKRQSDHENNVSQANNGRQFEIPFEVLKIDAKTVIVELSGPVPDLGALAGDYFTVQTDSEPKAGEWYIAQSSTGEMHTLERAGIAPDAILDAEFICEPSNRSDANLGAFETEDWKVIGVVTGLIRRFDRISE